MLAGRMAIEEFYPPTPLEELVGTWREQDGRRLMPLPHPSGVSRWLNLPAHRALLERSLAQLSVWREELGLDDDRERESRSAWSPQAGMRRTIGISRSVFV